MSIPRVQRYPPGLDFVSFSEPPKGVVAEVAVLKAQDGGVSRGVLYSSGGERTVVCIVHPRADMTRHYLVPHLVDNGYAFFAQESRWPGSDVATVHEILLADIAATLIHLRVRGFQSVVLLGNSGAGPLYSLYQAQAATDAPDRLTDTAAGDPYDLNALELPKANGMIYLGAHLGPGKILETEIDPSVTDEGDALSCDPALDMYRAANGFREPPQTSSYSTAFIARYRTGQAARVARIDAIAREYIAEQRSFRGIAGDGRFAGWEPETQRFVQRRALRGRFLHVHRIDASPGSTDLTVHPSQRGYGSLMSVRPDLTNYGEAGTKILTPRAWLSSWSGLSSRASVLDSLPKVTIPTLVSNYSGDNAIYPVYADMIYERSVAADKSRAQFEGDHFGLMPDGMRKRDAGSAAAVILEWLQRRFPASSRG